MTPLTIRQMADRFGVTLRLLRFYEAKDLLVPSRAPSSKDPDRLGTNRLYGADEVETMERLMRWRAMGLPLDAMFRIDINGEAEEPHLRARRAAIVTELALLGHQLAAVEERLDQLGWEQVIARHTMTEGVA